MSKIRTWALALALAVVWTAGAAAEMSYTTTFTGLCDSESEPQECTDRPDKWECWCNWTNLEPTGAAITVIPQGFTDIVVEDNDSACGSIEIASGSVVTIKEDAVLTIWNEAESPPGDSQIDGTLQIEKDGELKVWDDKSVTIKGDGGEIKGLDAGGTDPPLITGYNGSPSCSETLTIEDDGSGGLDVHGVLDIRVELVNDASVIADADDEILVLSGCAKSGAGSWAAENDGTLQVDSAVTGAGTWELEDDMDAEIEFNVQCTSLTGRFTITKGTLDVNAYIQTYGGLTFQSVNGSNPRIDIAEDRAATFWEY